MHILVTNDDGPPSDQSSPYVHSFVSTLQAHGHTVSVILPHTQRSWIGKAHLVGKSIKPTYYRPLPLQTTPEGRLTNHGSTHATPLPASSSSEEWILIDSTPASCIQIGLYHYFSSRGPIDLVISGPNYGRNSTAVFSLSSGTVGGALEGAVCGVRSIALSYAFFDRNHDASIIEGASRISARLVQRLWDTWEEGAQLYTVNVPLVEGVETRKILRTHMLQNRWRSGSCFQVVDAPRDEEKDAGAQESEKKIRQGEEEIGKVEMQSSSAAKGEGGDDVQGVPDTSSSSTSNQKHVRYTHKHFKWAPSFKDVYESVDESEPGNDGWAVAQGYTSVTALRANFMHAGVLEGEIVL